MIQRKRFSVLPPPASSRSLSPLSKSRSRLLHKIDAAHAPLIPICRPLGPPVPLYASLACSECRGDIFNLKLLAAELVQGLAADTFDLTLGLGSFSDIEVRSFNNIAIAFLGSVCCLSSWSCPSEIS